MVDTYTSLASICKTILPFSLKKKQRLPAAEQRLSKQQSDNLKWQQDWFHQILNLMGLAKEGIVSQNELSAFRTHLLETLITSPVDHEPPLVLRDKLIFLQELLYAKCIPEEEYHASKRPLLQRLAVQGAEIDARDVIVGARNETSNEEWSVIDLKDAANQHTPTTKENSTLKQRMKGAAASVFGLVSPHKNTKSKATTYKELDDDCHTENPFWNGLLDESESSTILMVESIIPSAPAAKPKNKHFNLESTKKSWGFDGFKKWKKNNSVDEKSSDVPSYVGKLVPNPVAEGPNTKQIKRKLHPNGAPTDFFVDKVLGEKIKKELCRYPDVHLSDDQIEVISTRLPVDKADLIKIIPKSQCDQCGDIVLDVVRKGFKEHMREMGHSRSKSIEKAFDDENLHPNLFVKRQSISSSDNIRGSVINSSIDKGFKYNPFFDM